MKAYRFDDFGSPDDLRLREERDPEPQRGEGLVRVRASGRGAPARGAVLRGGLTPPCAGLTAWTALSAPRRSAPAMALRAKSEETF